MPRECTARALCPGPKLCQCFTEYSLRFPPSCGSSALNFPASSSLHLYIPPLLTSASLGLWEELLSVDRSQSSPLRMTPGPQLPNSAFQAGGRLPEQKFKYLCAACGSRLGV